MFAWTIYLSFSGVACLMALKPEDVRSARLVAMVTSVGGLLVALVGAGQFNPGAGLTTVAKVPWVSALGLEYHLAVDGISVTLVVLTGLAAVAGVLFSWNIEFQTKRFFAFYLALIGGVYGVFLSFDLFLLFVFYELAIVPKYFLIAGWGTTRREYGAMKLALYSFVGSAMILAGLLAAYVVAGATTFNLVELAKFPFPRGFQMWAFPLVFTGFAVLAGLWPFHSWAPTGHVAAPTAASMLLAGVIMKLGAYGCLRVAMTLFPLGLHDWASPVLGFASWRDVFGVLAVIGIVYGAMVALVQRDFKFVIGYSSVSHMGFVILGLMTLSVIGLSGAVLQMFSHGVIAGLLFAVVGRMVYDRTHTRVLDELELLGLNRALPFAAGTFVVAGLASMGMPGFSGFVAEFQVLIGAWKAFPTLAVLAGVGVLVGVAYTLRAMQKAFFSASDLAPTSAELAGAELAGAPAPALEPVGTMGAMGSGHVGPSHSVAAARAGEWPERAALGTGSSGPGHSGHGLGDISIPERLGATLLIALTLLIGVYPRLLLDWIEPALHSPLMEQVLKAGDR
ncbi:MAG TPA: NADH-quinone oxidoreductase subunit M [Verrucomicrobiae bacterium]|nr:NADH-quinone oxidoreductase subunit M [Verrucomicrobiae bacterium]